VYKYEGRYSANSKGPLITSLVTTNTVRYTHRVIAKEGMGGVVAAPGSRVKKVAK
jgi:hypothetical protein